MATSSVSLTSFWRLGLLSEVLGGEAEGAGLVQPEEEKAERGPNKCL